MSAPIATARPRAPRRATGCLQRLERMTPAERLAAYRSGQLNSSERALWARTFPNEVPVVNGEVEWIALGLADLD